MTEQNKQLLIKDLCARIPYHTFVQLNPGAYNKPETCILTGVHGEKIHLNVDSDPFRIDNIKPYLRPMSSMTEKEWREFSIFTGKTETYVQQVCLDTDSMINPTIGGYKCVYWSLFDKCIDWLNAHHFDYRIDPSTNKTLIESGLAIEAKEGMYKF